jgi:hypothetical protein
MVLGERMRRMCVWQDAEPIYKSILLFIRSVACSFLTALSAGCGLGTGNLTAFLSQAAGLILLALSIAYAQSVGENPQGISASDFAGHVTRLQKQLPPYSALPPPLDLSKARDASQRFF